MTFRARSVMKSVCAIKPQTKVQPYLNQLTIRPAAGFTLPALTLRARFGPALTLRARFGLALTTAASPENTRRSTLHRRAAKHQRRDERDSSCRDRTD